MPLEIKLWNPKIKVDVSSFNIEQNELIFELMEWSYFNFIGRGITDVFRRSRRHVQKQSIRRTTL